ncbi:MAG: phage portal protein [Anaerolineaceae bacterium]
MKIPKLSQLFKGKDSKEDRVLAGIKEVRDDLNIVMQEYRTQRASSEGFVTPNTSLHVAAVWACVRLISETVASLPLFIYEEKNGERKRAKDHYLYGLLHDQPNPVMSAMELRGTLQEHLVLQGNAYSQLIYDEAGRVVEIWPMRPDRMLEVKLENGRKYFHYQKENGSTEWMTGDEVWHIPGLGFNGVVGHSPIWMLRKSVALAMDAEEFGSRFFVNDARPGIIIEHPGVMSDQAIRNLKESVEEQYQGVSQSHKPMILEEGSKLHEVGIPPEDAQFLQTRQFQVREIARAFRVPPHMIADMEQATFSNIEHQSLEFVIHSIRPWLVRWEQSIHMNLLLPSERKRFYPEHLVDGLLRGDTLSRYQSYAYGKQWGWLSSNDIRRMENLNAVDGGDTYLSPLNYMNQKDIRTSIEHVDGFEEAEPLQPDREKRLNDSTQILFVDVMGRVIKREVQDLKTLGKKHLPSGNSDLFRTVVKDFYKGHMEWVKRQITPVFTSFSILTGAETPDIGGICERFCQIYQEKALEEVEKIIKNAESRGVDALAALENDLDSWQESRIKVNVSQDGRSLLVN